MVQGICFIPMLLDPCVLSIYKHTILILIWYVHSLTYIALFFLFFLTFHIMTGNKYTVGLKSIFKPFVFLLNFCSSPPNVTRSLPSTLDGIKFIQLP